MKAIFKKELWGYFSSPIGAIFLAVFWFFSGFYFFAGVCMQNTADLSILFESLFMILLLLVPVLTMRLFSEEYRAHTDQLLFSAPARLFSIVLGKYFAALCLFAITISITLVYAGVLLLFAPLSPNMLAGCVGGLLLLGMALVAIGLFVSSLTSSQVVSAFGTFGLFLVFMYLDSFAQFMPFDWLQSLLSALSFMGRYRNFTSGFLNPSDILYFLSVAGVFLFLTTRVLDKRRWS